MYSIIQFVLEDKQNYKQNIIAHVYQIHVILVRKPFRICEPTDA